APLPTRALPSFPYTTLFRSLEQCRVPTIAAIAGACTGGGAGIAACCDLRIGTKTTRIGFPIARTLGNCLSMSSISRLTALVGPRSEEHTSELQSPCNLVCRL